MDSVEVTLNNTNVSVNSTNTSVVTLDFGFIDGTGKTLSSVLLCSLTRVGTALADDYANGIYAVSADFHYEIDTVGSRQQFIK